MFADVVVMDKSLGKYDFEPNWYLKAYLYLESMSLVDYVDLKSKSHVRDKVGPKTYRV